MTRCFLSVVLALLFGWPLGAWADDTEMILRDTKTGDILESAPKGQDVLICGRDIRDLCIKWMPSRNDAYAPLPLGYWVPSKAPRFSVGLDGKTTMFSCGPEPSADLHCDSSVGKSEQIIANQLDASVALLGALILTTEQLQELKAALEQDNVKLRVTLIDHPCLAKMEVAMREMEYFIAVEREEPSYRSSNELLYGSLDAWQAHYDSTFKLWDAVKRTCWQERP